MLKKLSKFTLLSLSGLTLAACGNGSGNQDTAESNETETTETAEQAQNTENSEDTVIKVASHLEPMTDVVEIAGEVIEEPYSIELVNVSDNIQYNEAVLNDEAYANFAQHEPFMEQFNQERDGDLVALDPIYNANVGFYSQEYDSIEDIEDNIEVAIPADATNESRALKVLEAHDLIEIDDAADDFFVTVDDITENPHNFEFTSIDLLNLPAAYEDGIPLVFNYPTYVEPLGLTTDDAVMLEPEEDDTFALRVVVREGNADNEKTEAMMKAFKSQEVYDFLEELQANGHLTIAFEPGE